MSVLTLSEILVAKRLPVVDLGTEKRSFCRTDADFPNFLPTIGTERFKKVVSTIKVQLYELSVS